MIECLFLIVGKMIGAGMFLTPAVLASYGGIGVRLVDVNTRSLFLLPCSFPGRPSFSQRTGRYLCLDQGWIRWVSGISGL